MTDERYAILFEAMMRYPGLDDLEIRDSFLQVLYDGSKPSEIPIICSRQQFVLSVLVYTKKCDMFISSMMAHAGQNFVSDIELKTVARFVSAGLDKGYEDVEGIWKH